MEYNLTSNDKVHKYTINLPIPLFDAMAIKSKEVGFGELAPWVRAVIIREVYSGTFTLQDVIGEKEFFRREITKKMEGEEPKKQSWVAIKISKISNIINPKQQFFKWES